MSPPAPPSLHIAPRPRDDGGASEKKGGKLLDWLLQKYPDTPRSRAKQWILAGRVCVNGVVVRKPHLAIEAPGDSLRLMDRQTTTLDCGAGWQIHPRVSLLYLDSALAIVNKGPGLISVPAPNCDLSALSILADFFGGETQGPATRCRRQVAAAGLSAAGTIAGASVGSIHQRGFLHRHESQGAASLD